MPRKAKSKKPQSRTLLPQPEVENDYDMEATEGWKALMSPGLPEEEWYERSGMKEEILEAWGKRDWQPFTSYLQDPFFGVRFLRWLLQDDVFTGIISDWLREVAAPRPRRRGRPRQLTDEQKVLKNREGVARRKALVRLQKQYNDRISFRGPHDAFEHVLSKYADGTRTMDRERAYVVFMSFWDWVRDCARQKITPNSTQQQMDESLKMENKRNKAALFFLDDLVKRTQR